MSRMTSYPSVRPDPEDETRVDYRSWGCATSIASNIFFSAAPTVQPPAWARCDYCGRTQEFPKDGGCVGCAAALPPPQAGSR